MTHYLYIKYSPISTSQLPLKCPFLQASLLPRSQPGNTYCYESACLASSSATAPRLSLSEILSLSQSPVPQRWLLAPPAFFWLLLSFFSIPCWHSSRTEPLVYISFPRAIFCQSLGERTHAWNQPDPDLNCGSSQPLPSFCF